MPTPRYYVDTSVIGGCYDEKFATASRALLARVRKGELTLIASSLLIEELEPSPPRVRRILDELPASHVQRIIASEESSNLQASYLRAKVVGNASAQDAHHVALATIARADIIVSWNFKHIVNVDKIKGFNAVNLMLGYNTIDIRSPLEVIR
jgi:predicted nucleic acid-binding protein